MGMQESYPITLPGIGPLRAYHGLRWVSKITKAKKGGIMRTGTLAAFFAGTGAGAAAEYLLDPHDGRRRRHQVRDQAAAKLRRRSREAGRKAHYMAGKARGVAAHAVPHESEGHELNDPALAAKVESELFRPANAPKGSVDVNVVGGVVYLRGALPSREQINELIHRARKVDGVQGVESLLHLPGEPAPPPRAPARST
jgi:BON domain